MFKSQTNVASLEESGDLELVLVEGDELFGDALGWEEMRAEASSNDILLLLQLMNLQFS